MTLMEEIQNQSTEALSAMSDDLKREIYDLKCELSLNKKLDKPHMLKQKKKERARVLTALRSKKQAS
jgi:large subunit ribosomal protein L29